MQIRHSDLELMRRTKNQLTRLKTRVETVGGAGWFGLAGDNLVAWHSRRASLPPEKPIVTSTCSAPLSQLNHMLSHIPHRPVLRSHPQTKEVLEKFLADDEDMHRLNLTAMEISRQATLRGDLHVRLGGPGWDGICIVPKGPCAVMQWCSGRLPSPTYLRCHSSFSPLPPSPVTGGAGGHRQHQPQDQQERVPSRLQLRLLIIILQLLWLLT